MVIIIHNPKSNKYTRKNLKVAPYLYPISECTALVLINLYLFMYNVFQSLTAITVEN